MAATLAVSVSYAGSNGSPTNAEAGVTGVDFISADNGTNSLANRQANPITVGNYSYEKWVRLKITSSPANFVGTFKVWGPGSDMTSSTLWWTGGLTLYTVPQSASNTLYAMTAFKNFTTSNKGNWDTRTNLFSVGTYTYWSVWQLQVGNDANPGNWTTETINYSYDEL